MSTPPRVVPLDRCSGILLHPTALPGRFGIGDIGPASYRFIDFLVEAGQSLWQVLPLNHVVEDHFSPYRSYSSCSGNPLLISPELLVKDGIVTNEELETISFPDSLRIEFPAIARAKQAVLQLAFSRFQNIRPPVLVSELEMFKNTNRYWLEPYSCFMASKQLNENRPWTQWVSDQQNSTQPRAEETDEFYSFAQFLFFRQWHLLRSYAKTNGIRILGDVPVCVAHDSADVWSNPELFVLEPGTNEMTLEAGCAPDAFFDDEGTRWHSPIYNWPKHAENRFAWWKNKVRFNLELFDSIRLDHFRGFESFWVLPTKASSAREGWFLPGPGEPFFEELLSAFPGISMVVEDLGLITPQVVSMREKYGFAGFKILQFAFDGTPDNPYLPEKFVSNCVAYTGTHDNNTTRGWYGSLDENSRQRVHALLGQVPEDQISDHLCRLAENSAANWCILPIQDILNLGSDTRFNTPGDTTLNSWSWRLSSLDFGAALCQRLQDMAQKSGRLPPDR